MNTNRNSLSSKDLRVKDKLHLYLLGSDPFENLKPTKKNPAILKPIRHRRLISENSSIKFPKNLKPKIPENKLISGPQSLQSPRLSPQSFLKLNPSFKNSKLRFPSKVIDLKAPKLNLDVAGPCIKAPSKSLGGILGLHRDNFKGNFLVRKGESANLEMEFSFGKS